MLPLNWFIYFNCDKETETLATLISATSANPPTENRKNLRFKARAIERPILVQFRASLYLMRQTRTSD